MEEPLVTNYINLGGHFIRIIPTHTHNIMIDAFRKYYTNGSKKTWCFLLSLKTILQPITSGDCIIISDAYPIGSGIQGIGESGPHPEVCIGVCRDTLLRSLVVIFDSINSVLPVEDVGWFD